jgi:voltage-gated potassium channel
LILPETSKKEQLTYFDLVIIALSIYILIALLIEIVFKLAPELSRLLIIIDNFICLVFLVDFVSRLIKSKDRLEFMRWGWIDLLSSIPNITFLRYGRVVRLIRLFRLLRAFRSTKSLIHYVFRNKPRGAFSSVALIALLMVIFCSIAILEVENSPNSNIHTAEDALWWAITTVTTVGYGDKFPVTTEGRVIAGILMFTGVGLFGTFTGFVASWFLDDKKKGLNN